MPAPARSPDARTAAAAIPEAVRVLAALTDGDPGDVLGDPAAAGAVIADLHLAAQRTQHVLDQIARKLTAGYEAARDGKAGDGSGPARYALDQATSGLWDAAADAAQIMTHLARAAAAVRDMDSPRRDEKEDDR
jgi:hypothetical protein